MKIQDYFKNTYVVLGIIGIAFYLYKKNESSKIKEVEPEEIEVKEVEPEVIDEIVKPQPVVSDDEKEDVGSNFIEDVSNMKTSTLKRTIETNKKMIKRAKMSVKKKEQIKSMLKYMKKEYDNRTRNK